MRYVLGLLVMTLALAGCGLDFLGGCQSAVKTYAGQIDPLVAEWQDGLKLAGNTPRASLAPQIANLQTIRRKVDGVTPPDCAKATHAKLVAGMDKGIQGFLDFLAQKPEETVNQEFIDAGASIAAFNAELLSLGGIAPTPAQ